MQTGTVCLSKNRKEVLRAIEFFGCSLLSAKIKDEVLILEAPDYPNYPDNITKVAEFSIDSNLSNLSTIFSENNEYFLLDNNKIDVIKSVTDFSPISFHTPEGCNNAKKLVYFSHHHQLSDLLKNSIFPAFFSENPSGYICVLKLNYLYEKLSAFFRCMFYLNKFDIEKLCESNQGFAGLRQWHNFAAFSFVEKVLQLPFILFYPDIKGIIAGPIGYLIVFLFSDTPQEELRFPLQWSDFYASPGDFSGQKKDVNTLFKNPESAWKKHIPLKKVSTQQMRCIVDWYIKQINSFTKWMFAFNQYTEGGFISFQRAQETILSIDRLFSLCAVSVNAKTSIIGRMILFQIADILEGIVCRIKHNQNLQLFKELFRCNRAEKHFRQIFKKEEDCIKSVMFDCCINIYREIQNNLIKSAYLKNIHRSNCQIKTSNDCKCCDNFIVDVFRALRNSCHGYFPQTFRIEKHDDILWNTTGNVPDSANSLPLLWLSSFLLNPNNILNYAVLPRVSTKA